MTCPKEYHDSVRHSISASIVVLSLLALPTIFLSSSHAQINGVPASVTSPGFGGRVINGTPSSVTSLGPRGYSSHARVSFSTTNNRHDHDGDGRHHHHFVPYA